MTTGAGGNRHMSGATYKAKKEKKSEQRRRVAKIGKKKEIN